MPIKTKSKSGREKRQAKIIKLMGIGPALHKFRSAWREFLIHEHPNVLVEYHPETAPELRNQDLIDRITKKLYDLTVTLNGETLTYREYSKTSVPICRAIFTIQGQEEKYKLTKSECEALKVMVEKAEIWTETWSKEFKTLVSSVFYWELYDDFNLELIYDYQYSANMDVSIAPRYLVSVMKSAQSSIVHEGKTRTIYRMGYFGNEYKPGVLKDAAGNEYEFWMQKHALLRAKERQNVTSNYVVFTTAMLKGKLIPKLDGRFLLECSLSSDKIGYLLLKKYGNKLVAITYYTITMLPMEEGVKLAKALRHTRDDLSYNNLDKLSTLIMTDLLDDPKISKIFIDSGCESLVRLRQQNVKKGYQSNVGIANEFSKYYMLKKETP